MDLYPIKNKETLCLLLFNLVMNEIFRILEKMNGYRIATPMVVLHTECEDNLWKLLFHICNARKEINVEV